MLQIVSSIKNSKVLTALRSRHIINGINVVSGIADVLSERLGNLCIKLYTFHTKFRVNFFFFSREKMRGSAEAWLDGVSSLDIFDCKFIVLLIKSMRDSGMLLDHIGRSRSLIKLFRVSSWSYIWNLICLGLPFIKRVAGWKNLGLGEF